MKWRIFLDILKYLWIFCVLIFAGHYINQNWSKFVEVSQSIPPLNIGLSLCCILITKLLLALNFQQAVRMSGQPLAFLPSNYIYQVSQMGKYIPGSIWQFVGKAGMLKKKEVPGKKIAVSILLETSFVLGSAALFGFWIPFYVLPDYFSSSYLWLLLIGVTILSSCASILFFKTVKKLFLFLSKNKKQLLEVIGNQALIWSLFGLSLVLLNGTPINVNIFSEWPLLIGIFSFSYFVSFLVPFAPAGIGIREGLIITGFQLYGIDGNAAFVALAHRLLYFFAEGFLVFLLVAFKPFRSNTHASD